MDFLDFILDRQTNKLVGDVKSDLWAYREILQKKKDAKSKIELKRVEKLLDMYQEKPIEHTISKIKLRPGEKKIRDELIDSIKDYFGK